MEGRGGNVWRGSNIMGLWKSNVETYNYRSFLTYMPMKKCMNGVTNKIGETVCQLDILCPHVKLPVPGMGYVLLSPSTHMEAHNCL